MSVANSKIQAADLSGQVDDLSDYLDRSATGPPCSRFVLYGLRIPTSLSQVRHVQVTIEMAHSNLIKGL